MNAIHVTLETNEKYETAVDETAIDDLLGGRRLSWENVSVADDGDLLAKIATFFDGMEPDEPRELLRAKCRLLPVEPYVHAQAAAEEELRNQAVARWGDGQ